jgi:Fe-S-cluster containining protein
MTDRTHPESDQSWDWRRADRILLAEVDRGISEAYRRAGDRMVCRPGCSDCCIGLFTINALDVRRLRVGLRRLERRDLATASAIRARARAVVEKIRADFPEEEVTCAVQEQKIDQLVERFGDVPCPALNPVSRICELYAYRPMSCRTYGPPVQIGDEKLAPCALCFKGARAAEIEACRIEPDPDDLEHAILCELAGPAEVSGETIVPYALRAEAPGGKEP